MSGIFGIASRQDCMDELFYGTDYHSHLGTQFGGLAIQGTRVHLVIVAGSQRDPDGPVDGHGQYEAVVVVGVLADQVDPPGRPDDVRRRRAETTLKRLCNGLFERHSSANTSLPGASAPSIAPTL